MCAHAVGEYNNSANQIDKKIDSFSRIDKTHRKPIRSALNQWNWHRNYQKARQRNWLRFYWMPRSWRFSNWYRKCSDGLCSGSGNNCERWVWRYSDIYTYNFRGKINFALSPRQPCGNTILLYNFLISIREKLCPCTIDSISQQLNNCFMILKMLIHTDFIKFK